MVLASIVHYNRIAFSQINYSTEEWWLHKKLKVLVFNGFLKVRLDNYSNFKSEFNFKLYLKNSQDLVPRCSSGKRTVFV